MVGDPIFPTNSAQYGNSTNPNAPRAMGTPVTIELAAHKQDWLGRSSRRTSQRARAGHVRLILLRLPGTRQLLCGDGLGDGPDLSQLHFLTQPTTGLSPPHTHTVAQKTSNQVHGMLRCVTPCLNKLGSDMTLDLMLLQVCDVSRTSTESCFGCSQGTTGTSYHTPRTPCVGGVTQLAHGWLVIKPELLGLGTIVAVPLKMHAVAGEHWRQPSRAGSK